ncbi:MAG: metallophosphoesterase [Micropruina sp.]|nr:metallophosphoesterase [Micropruina sp.]
MVIRGGRRGEGHHPFFDLSELIRAQAIKTDLLVFPGDLADKARPEALRWAWACVRRIAGDLGGAQIIVTTGNHDLDSRSVYNDHDAKGVLLELTDYPYAEPSLNNEYWARSAVLHQSEAYNILVLNSAAYHGYSDESKHGQYRKHSSVYKELLLEAETNKLNIFVCHHHLYRYGNIDPRDYSEMVDGSVLLGVLGSGEFGKWLVIHGHRHWPNLEYAAGTLTHPRSLRREASRLWFIRSCRGRLAINAMS